MSGGVASEKYNRIYEALVRDDGDIVGLLSYSIYKQHKREWIIDHVRENGGPPDAGALSRFEESNRLPSQLDRYRRSAAELLQAYSAETVRRYAPEIREAALTQQILSAANAVAESTAWYRKIPAGIAAAFAYTLLLIAIALVLRYADIDLVSIWMAVRGS